MLAGLAASVALLGTDDCGFLGDDGCEDATADPLWARFTGFVCLGGGEESEPPTAKLVIDANPIRIVHLRVSGPPGQVFERIVVLNVRRPEAAGADVSAVARAAARARFRVDMADAALRLRGRVRTRARPPRLPPPRCGRG